MSFKVNNQDQDPRLFLSLQEWPIEMKQSPDTLIAEESRQDLKQLESDLEDLTHSFHILSQFVEEQAPDLEQVSEKVALIQEDTDAALDSIEVVADKNTDKKRTGVFAAIGGASGLGFGALGFIFGPVVGIPTTLIFLGVGATTGAIVSKVKPKKRA